MKKIFLPVFIMLFFTSCSRHGILKSYAYVRKSVAGTIRVDDNGRPMNSGITTEHLLFVETDSSKGLPQWGTAWIDQTPYSIQPVQIKNPKQVIGKTGDGKEVSFDVKRGHQLWQLVLLPKKDSVVDTELQENIRNSKILLSGRWKDKAFTHKISKENELQRLELQ